MAINPLASNILNLTSPEPISSIGGTLRNDAQDATGSFADIFTEAFNTANVTDTQGKASMLALVSGQSDDMAGIMIDGQKAEIALNLAVTLRNKVLESYQEVMRMQV